MPGAQGRSWATGMLACEVEGCPGTGHLAGSLASRLPSRKWKWSGATPLEGFLQAITGATVVRLHTNVSIRAGERVTVLTLASLPSPAGTEPREQGA